MLDLYIEQGQKRLRCGYTTGSCAAAAAKAAVQMLLTGQIPKSITLLTPKGISVQMDVLDPVLEEQKASCAVQKDSGDDPDITNGILIYASVEKCADGIIIDGGQGVGRVTKPGLNQPVGAAAINSVPRQMILQACQEMAQEYGYIGGFRVVISIPQGEALAKRTFNPKLGILGGLSIIGTTGIVEPMSQEALLRTIRLELHMLAEAGEKAVLLSPGNYGADFTKNVLHLDTSRQILCSNFIGDAVEMAISEGFHRILLIGHIGKLVKLGIGMKNTHSCYGDGRMETMAACAAEIGVRTQILQKILSCVSTDAAITVLREADLLHPVMKRLGERIEATFARDIPEDVTFGFVCFTNAKEYSGVLVESPHAEKLMERWRKS